MKFSETLKLTIKSSDYVLGMSRYTLVCFYLFNKNTFPFVKEFDNKIYQIRRVQYKHYTLESTKK